MILEAIAKLIGLKNPWPKMEKLVSIMDAERIHEKNKEVIANLILGLSTIDTIAIAIILYMYNTYSVSFIPLFLSATVLAIMPIISTLINREVIAVILSTVITTAISIPISTLIDFNINVVHLLIIPILILSIHFWKYLLNDLDKNMYHITQAGINLGNKSTVCICNTPKIC